MSCLTLITFSFDRIEAIGRKAILSSSKRVSHPCAFAWRVMSCLSNETQTKPASPDRVAAFEMHDPMQFRPLVPPCFSMMGFHTGSQVPHAFPLIGPTFFCRFGKACSCQIGSIRLAPCATWVFMVPDRGLLDAENDYVPLTAVVLIVDHSQQSRNAGHWSNQSISSGQTSLYQAD